MSLTEPIHSTPGELRKFGFLFAVVFSALAALSAYKGNSAWPWLLGAACFFVLAGFFLRPILRPLYAAWMRFAFLLGWINTRLLLGVFFYLILTPIGLVMRLFGRDSLHRKFDKKASSYWVKREPAEFRPERYEQLF